MRGKKAPQKKIKPEVKYNSPKLAKFINYVMRKGKKSIATKIVYQTLDIIKEKKQQDPLKTFQNAMENISPVVEVRSRRIGGANYQIPFPTNEDRRFVLASRWLIQAAKSRKGRTMADKLAQEILDAAEKQGGAIKKKEDVHRMAQANKAFAHFARY
jgi:small subunit ribosomal protein S7